MWNTGLWKRCARINRLKIMKRNMCQWECSSDSTLTMTTQRSWILVFRELECFKLLERRDHCTIGERLKSLLIFMYYFVDFCSLLPLSSYVSGDLTFVGGSYDTTIVSNIIAYWLPLGNLH